MLVLDEPTNHLDLSMRNALMLALQNFEGVLILVSHDRDLVMNVCDNLMLVANGRADEFTGDMADYAEHLRQARLAKLAQNKAENKETKPTPPRPSATNLPYPKKKSAKKMPKTAKKPPHFVKRLKNSKKS